MVGLWPLGGSFSKNGFYSLPGPARSWGFWAGRGLGGEGRKPGNWNCRERRRPKFQDPEAGASERRGGADPLRPRIQSDTPSVLLLLSLALFYNFVSINPGRALVL